ncbi:MAG: zinc ABC transporter substrate-binding protein [Alphaproteobacteria bacterium]|nr:zinc ABC transporter substrate-binding protein [Alphaproteobacteria bacterium]
MRILFLIMAGLGVLIASPSSAFAKVNVFACEAEWAALAQEIGGDLVDVTSATNARQDVHHLRAKPSLLAAMRKADLVFCTGASLEVGWLPILLKKAGGPDVQMETVGSVMASDYVEKLEIMQKVDRSMGHVHPEGNPHIQLDPANIKIVAEVLADRLFIIDQANAAAYNQNLENFKQKWAAATQRWKAEKASLKGKKVVVYHNSWAYLLKWLGIKAVASLEPKPGLPPTASHLDEVLKTVQGQNVSAILVAPFENEDAAQWLTEKAGIPIVRLPFTVGGNDNADDLISLFDNTLSRLKDAP